MTRILGISGSLRAKSSNSALLRAAARLAPPEVHFTLFTELGTLPLFNPDLDETEPPGVMALRHALREADAVVIASPEYAHGVTGVIKNALDWVVGSAEFEGKPVALLNASARSVFAPAALRETLTVMGGQVIDAASLTVNLRSNRIDEFEALAMPAVTDVLQQMLAELVAAANELGVTRDR